MCDSQHRAPVKFADEILDNKIEQFLMRLFYSLTYVSYHTDEL